VRVRVRVCPMRYVATHTFMLSEPNFAYETADVLTHVEDCFGRPNTTGHSESKQYRRRPAT